MSQRPVLWGARRRDTQIGGRRDRAIQALLRRGPLWPGAQHVHAAICVDGPRAWDWRAGW